VTIPAVPHRPAAALAAVAALAVWAGWIEPRRLVLRHDTIELPDWPPALDGLRVGLLADLHAGVPYMDAGTVARAVARLNAEAPDLVLLLGDYVDASALWTGRIAPDVVARELAALRAPLGRFAVLGNHDWYATGGRMWIALRDVGIPVLENRAVPIDAPGGRLWVAGLADLRHRLPDIAATLRDVPPGRDEPVLLMAHDPDVHPGVPDRVALTVSGHIHAGQIAIPLVRRFVIPSAYGERYARRHRIDGGRRLYVTSGAGSTGLPVRLLAPPEVVVLELRSPRG
jgi:predicted MPP superfamily phosphohydrolase